MLTSPDNVVLLPYLKEMRNLGVVATTGRTNTLEDGIFYLMVIFVFFLLLLTIVETRKYKANARVTVDNSSIFDGKSSQISPDEAGRENLVWFIFYEFNCNYLNRTRRICVQLDFYFILRSGAFCTRC